MFYRSIRFKVTVVYMVILALTLSAFSLILYHYVDRSLRENMDTLLRSKAEGIVYAINTYWATEKLGARRYGVKPKAPEEAESVDLISIAQRWVESRSKDPKLLDIIVKIFDADGVPLASSKNTQGISNVSRETLIAVLQGYSRFETVSSSFPTKKEVTFRVFITPAIENDKVEYIVEVASPLASIQTTLNILKVTLLLLFPLTVLITGIMGFFIAKLSLQPVNSMIKTIHEITAENLKLKLKVPDTKDEIQKLAETFNDMIMRLDNAFTSQRQLFEDLSHELKTPLTILKGEFEVILKSMRSREEYETILRSGLEEIDKLSKLAENMLMLASLESRKLLPAKGEVDLVPVIQRVINNIKRLAENKGVDIDFIKSDNSLSILGDEKQLKQMFLNLLDNAIKYTPSGGRVTIDLKKEKDAAKIKIADTGIGIPRDELESIFNRFYRVDKSRASHGFGLGLSIVKSIVEAHNGRISVESVEGKGTAFTISLKPH